MARRPRSSRRRPRPPRAFPGDAQDPGSLTAWCLRFLRAQEVRNLSPNTLVAHEQGLYTFACWCQERGVHQVTAITRPILQRYQRHLFLHRKPDGRPLAPSTQKHRLQTLRRFFAWVTREDGILSNPASELEMPRVPRGLPKDVLTPEEAEVVLQGPDLTSPLGLRDRALLEVLYATGIRRMELAGLTVFDVDAGRQTVFVREGKGGKDRVVPLGERALAWVGRYLDEVRPELVVGSQEGTLFLTRDGLPFRLEQLTRLVRGYVERAELGKGGACHLFRHTMATAMLENGADVRHIQEMLGHAQLTTTQVYTRVSIRTLREVHQRTHPGARLTWEAGEDELAGEEG